MQRTRIAAYVVVSLSLVAATNLMPKKHQTVPLIVAPSGDAPNDSSRSPILAGSGKVAALATNATNLVGTDVDAVRDILVVKLRKGLITCASVSTEGVKADGDSDDPALDKRGRHVAFASLATNLVEGDSNGVQDIFVHDVRTAGTVRASVATDGTEADGPSQQPWVSSSGRYVVFASEATNLVADDTNGASDIFLRDLVAGTTQRVSVAADGTQGDGDSLLPRVSGTGRYVAFVSQAQNLVALDDNNSRDVFVRDLKTGAMEIASVSTGGAAANGHCDTLSLSANGRYVAFDSRAGNLDVADEHEGLDVFLRDRRKHTTKLVSKVAGDGVVDGASTQPALSGNGKWLAFSSGATSLVPGDLNEATDVFRVKLKSSYLERVSVSSTGSEADNTSDSPALSRSGKFVVFSTRATNLFGGGATDGTWAVALRKP